MAIKFNNTDNVLEQLAGPGAFLTAGKDGKANVMTIGWGFVGVMWYRRVVIVPVRESRYTKQFIEENGEFCVSVPLNGALKKELAYCGSHSGRDGNKFEAAGLNTLPATKVSAPVIDGCSKYYECKLLSKLPLNKDMFPDEINEYAYKTNDLHTLYLGEIVAEYDK